jgi:glutamate 5-kinase
MKTNMTVVKLGSEVIANNEGVMQEQLDMYAHGLVENYYEDGLIVVTSGAVLAGKARVTEKGDDPSEYSDVTLAQLGSSVVMRAWEEAFDKAGVLAGGLLTTHHEIEDSQEGPTLFKAIELARERRVACVINENDALSVRELMKLANCEDNDELSAHIAVRIGARALRLFTKNGGIMEDDGTLIEEVNEDNYARLYAMLLGRNNQRSTNSNGRGGMFSKFNVAWEASLQGIVSDIAMPNADMTGEKVTRFVIG